jgi:hypothetical protein
MKAAERLMLILSGLIGIGSFFLPYFFFKGLLTDFGISGYNLVEAGLSVTDVMASDGGKKLWDAITLLWENTASFKDMMAFAAILLILLTPVYFGFHFLAYLIRGLFGRHYKRGIFFALIHMGLCWLVLYLIGKDNGADLNFFRMAGVGYWIGFGAMILAAFSSFFEKEGDSGGAKKK